MIAEVAVFNDAFVANKPSDLVITTHNYDSRNPSKRPAGWSDIKAKRILLLEKIDRTHGIDEETSLRSKRPQRFQDVCYITIF
jgi:hypothetical protein